MDVVVIVLGALRRRAVTLKWPARDAVAQIPGAAIGPCLRLQASCCLPAVNRLQSGAYALFQCSPCQVMEPAGSARGHQGDSMHVHHLSLILPTHAASWQGSFVEYFALQASHTCCALSWTLHTQGEAFKLQPTSVASRLASTLCRWLSNESSRPCMLDRAAASSAATSDSFPARPPAGSRS